MLIGLAILLVFLTFGLKAYAEWTGNATVGALGYLTVAGVMALIAFQVKSIFDNNYNDDNDVGLTIWLVFAVSLALAVGFGVYGMYKLQGA